MLVKNAIQKIHVYAYNSTTGAAKTGDAGNITGYVSLDGTANAIDDTNPAEVDATNMPGVYAFDLTAAETNCDSFALYAKSSTSNIRIEPIIGFTTTGTAAAIAATVPDTQKVDVNTIKTQTVTAGAAVTIRADVGAATIVPTKTEMEAAFTEIKGATWSVTTDTLEAIRDENVTQHLLTQTAIGNIGNVSAPSFAAPSSVTLTTYTNETNSYLNVDSLNNTYHSVSDSSGTLSLTYNFTLEPDEQASTLFWSGRWVGTNDTLTMEIYDWTTSAYATVTSRVGVSSDTNASDFTISRNIVGKYTSTAANGGGVAGKVLVKISGTGLSSCTLRTDQLIVGRTTSAGGIATGSTVTFAGSNTNQNYVGKNWTLILGTQDISGSYIEGAVNITGVASGTTPVTFFDCQFGTGAAGCTLPPGTYIRCGFNTPIGQPFTAASAGQYVFVDCYSLVAGSGTPYFDFSPVSTTTGINFRRWSGGAHITSDSNCTGTMEVVTGGGQTLVTGGASWELRGICRAVTVTLAGSETVRIDAVTGPVTVDGVGTGSTVRVYGVTSTVTSTASGSPTIDNASVSQATITTSATAATPTVSLANGAITDASLAGNMEKVFETDFSTNYDGTNKAWMAKIGNFTGHGGATASIRFNAVTIDNDVDVGGSLNITQNFYPGAWYIGGVQAFALLSADTGDTTVARKGSGTVTMTTLAAYVDDIGVAGAGLTALGDTRLANLDATVSSRQATISGIDTAVATIVKLDTTLVQDGAVYDFTAAALAAAPTGGGTAQTGDAYAYLTTNLGALGAAATSLASATELAKVPKSDSNVTWNATALASIQSESNDALTAFTGDTGITLAKALEMLAAFMAGKVTASSAGGVTTYTYKKRDGSTTSFTAECSETDGTRATIGSLS